MDDCEGKDLGLWAAFRGFLLDLGKWVQRYACRWTA